MYYADWMQQKKERRSAWLALGGGVLLVVAVTFLSSALALLNTPLTEPMPWFANIIVGGCRLRHSLGVAASVSSQELFPTVDLEIKGCGLEQLGSIN